MTGHVITIAVLLIVIAAAAGSWVRNLRRDRRLTHPLGAVAGLFGRALALYVIASAYWLWHGFAPGGTGHRGAACVDTAFPSGGGAGAGLAARAGAAISSGGDVQACALHPGLGQWGLYLLTRVPDLVLWGGLLLLVGQLVRQASRGGPFTARTAVLMQRLGWVIIGGSLAAGALAALGADLLTPMLMTPPTYSGGAAAIDILVYAPLKALLPVPALAGAALLTFARVTLAGTALDEEIQATV